MIDLRFGDCLELMRALPDNSVDSIVTDPPYGLSFMGKRWDYDVPSVEIWAECLRVLKPGGHLLAFAGTRTQHRMAVRIEDAGFEIRDMIAWVYGSGFPKSMDVSKAIDKAAGSEREVIAVVDPRGTFDGRERSSTAINNNWRESEGRSDVRDLSKKLITAPATDAARQWQGWGTALKPALEPITVARKPLAGTVAANVLAHGTGALNIDACRVAPTGESRARVGEASQDQRYTEAGATNFAAKPGIRGGDPSGRWPANLIHDGSPDVVALFPHTKSGVMKAGTRRAAQDEPGSVCYGTYGGNATSADTFGDSGSAARFFYCAKASKRDRGNDNGHPTVKPTDLMAYLCRMVTPPGGLVLDPFMGSGSTGKAAVREGFRFIGMEKEPEYFAIAYQRIYNYCSEKDL